MERTRFIIFLTIILFVSSAARAQTFQDFLARINAAPQQQHTALTDSFMSAVPAFPFIEQDTLVHFIYRGAANSVHVPGDANNWTPTAFPMNRIAATDLWYRTVIFERDARLDYKYVLNGSNWILDPLNPNTVAGGFGPNSELAMPGYVQPIEIQFRPEIAHGTVQDTTFTSTNLGNSREVRVYLPPGYDKATERYPVALFHDGLDYLNLASAHNIIDYLIAEKKIAPLIGIFVPAVNRNPEYAGNQIEEFSAFIVGELMPWVDSRYRTETMPARRAVLGASNGGNISLWLGISHPDVFGHVGAQSTNVESNVRSKFQNSEKQDLNLYIDIGTYDIPVLVDRVEVFLPVLDAKQYQYQFMQINEGHSWGNWRAHLDIILESFFPAQTTQIETPPELLDGFDLLQNYPNPFNPSTTIRYALGRPATINISIYNQYGQVVLTLVNERQPAGSHAVTWNGVDRSGTPQPSGVYYCKMQVNRQPYKTRRALLLK